MAALGSMAPSAMTSSVFGMASDVDKRKRIHRSHHNHHPQQSEEGASTQPHRLSQTRPKVAPQEQPQSQGKSDSNGRAFYPGSSSGGRAAGAGLTEWTWTGILSNRNLIHGLSWGVSCLKTDCKENQDGWAVQVYACTGDQTEPFTSQSEDNEEKKLTVPEYREPPSTNDPFFSSAHHLPQKSALMKNDVPIKRKLYPSFSFSWNHELTSMNAGLSGLLKQPTDSVNLPISGFTMGVDLSAKSVRSSSFDEDTHSASSDHNNTGSNNPQPCGVSHAITASSKDAYIGAATFVVLDGHGAGGRDAAAAVEKAFDAVFSRVMMSCMVPLDSDPMEDMLDASRDSTNSDGLMDSSSLEALNMLQVVQESLCLGQKTIEKLNNEANRDFGTTCVSVTLVEDILVSTACGDSSALLFAFPAGSWTENNPSKCPLIVELARRHNLEDKDELQRISTENKGRVIRGDGGVLRLIPSSMDYDEAKRRGLSINMGRSMGHAVFSSCGLSNEIDYSFLSLRQIPKLLAKAAKQKNGASFLSRNRPFNTEGGGHELAKCFRLPPLGPKECHRVIQSFYETRSRLLDKENLKPSSPFKHSSPSSNSVRLLKNNDEAKGAAMSAESSDHSNNYPPHASRLSSALPFGLRNHAAYYKRKHHFHHLHNVKNSVKSNSPSRATVGESSLGDYKPGLLSCFSRKSGGGGSPLNNENVAPIISPDHHVNMSKPQAKISSMGASTPPNYGRNYKTTSSKNGTRMGDIFILLMSDGVTDVLSSSCILEILKDFETKSKIRQKSFEPAAFALTLTEIARER